MRNVRLISVLTIAILFLMPINAQNQDKLTVQIEPIFISMWNNEKMAEVYTFSVTEFEMRPTDAEPGSTAVMYGVDYRAIAPAMKPKFNIIWKIENKEKKWKYGLRGWQLKTLAQESRPILTPETKENEDGSISMYLKSIRMWGYTFLPGGAKLYGFSDLPVEYLVKNSMHIRVRESYISRIFTNIFDVSLVFKTLEIDNDQILSQTHLLKRDDNDTHSENTSVSIVQTAETSYLIVGPGLGFNLQTKHINAFFQQSVLFGTAIHYGTWTNIENTILVDKETGITSEKPEEKGPYRVNYKTKITIPATELIVRYTWQKRFEEKILIKIGAGIFTSMFWQAPIAPRVSISHFKDIPNAKNWNIRKKDISTIGIMMSIAITFPQGGAK